MGIIDKIALVQCYIHHLKGVEVSINPPTSIRQILLLEDAYNTALNYFK